VGGERPPRGRARALAACAAWAETGEAGGAATADAWLRRVAPRALRGRRVEQHALAAAAAECDALAAELGAKEAEAAEALELDAAPARLDAARAAAECRGCSNPACVSTAGLSRAEAKALYKPMKCSRCVTARYCSAACQRADWPVHKQACLSLAAAGSAGAAGAEAEAVA
jgi:hypothetical protein